ncbi:autotransporter outer membrane beta-barrel domain-containing protein [Vogesella sp. EB]|uniref:autotransporter outer membrane beta-barrel domain-containing protein n=1 Tax=Vogesella sp. EB TaxID=1526735 RepID=UPI0009E4C3AB|nr:autotransporter outer membrane beta-barrel domain-containing protein [Vogesella sp. EB]
MRPTSSVKNITASLLLAGLCHAVYATPSITEVTVTGSDGKRYVITYTQTSFGASATQLRALPWWGNSTLADSLASASGELTGVNTGSADIGCCTSSYAGPVFAYTEDGGSVWGTFLHNSHTHSGEDPIPDDVAIYYALGRLALNVQQSSTNQSNNPALNAATIIDATPNLQALFNDLSTDQEISAAASQTLPLLTGGSMAAAGNALSGINKVIQARIESNRGLSAGDGFFGDKYVWVKPFGSWADQDDQQGVSGFKSTTTGVAFGVDSAVNDKLRLGTAMAYAKADVDSNSNVAKQSADVDVFQLVGYGSYSLGNNSEVNFQVDVGQNSNKGRRSIAFTNSTATSEYTSYTAHAGAGLGRTYQLSAATSITPSIRADYTWIKDKAYQESGAGLLNLNVGSRDSEEFVLGLDGKISHQLSDNTSLSANLGVGYDTMAKRSSITATFAGAPGAAFTTYGLDAEPWSARAGVGLTHTTANGTEITLRYDAEHREAFLNQTASLKARWAF